MEGRRIFQAGNVCSRARPCLIFRGGITTVWIGCNQIDRSHHDGPFSGMFKIHGGAAGRHGLDLSQSPVRPAGMAYEISGNETLGHGE